MAVQDAFVRPEMSLKDAEHIGQCTMLEVFNGGNENNKSEQNNFVL